MTSHSRWLYRDYRQFGRLSKRTSKAVRFLSDKTFREWSALHIAFWASVQHTDCFMMIKPIRQDLRVTCRGERMVRSANTVFATWQLFCQPMPTVLSARLLSLHWQQCSVSNLVIGIEASTQLAHCIRGLHFSALHSAFKLSAQWRSGIWCEPPRRERRQKARPTNWECLSLL